MKKLKEIKEKKESVCCNEEKMTCEPCDFEESIKVEE